ncbi:hypothetical protein CYMTET_35180 [Cymbomonas tetramitiformis]|uniref:Uncharacterized protein n=1 Tax=Cymbomonas tetramitiformis TaxID=36881 RepID=A0AAE0KPF6_9CHLO|nr:hypothetical protein CYMTET_35180 [Cymbomonas tetramitiformis]
MFVGKLFPSRDAALLRMSEVSERDGKLPQFGKQKHPGLGKRCIKNVDHLLAGCALDGTCQHCIEWRPFKQDGLWRCTTYTPQTCDAVNAIKKGTPSTAYTPEQLPPIATQKLVDNMNTYNLKQLKTYICSSTAVTMEPTATHLVTLTSAQMLEVLIDVEHKEFLYEQKSKAASERERWDRSKAGKYSVEEAGATYCLGWTSPIDFQKASARHPDPYQL